MPSLAMARSSASMASAPQPISSRKSRSGRADPSSPSPDLETSPPRPSPNSLGIAWAGGSDEPPPEQLDAAIIFATVGDLVPLALKAIRKGGRVVCAGIHMSDIPSFPYALLWEERQLLSVANLTRQDGVDFLRKAPEMGIVTHTTTYPLEERKPGPGRFARRPLRRRSCARALSRASNPEDILPEIATPVEY